MKQVLITVLTVSLTLFVGVATAATDYQPVGPAFDVLSVPFEEVYEVTATASLIADGTAQLHGVPIADLSMATGTDQTFPERSPFSRAGSLSLESEVATSGGCSACHSANLTKWQS